ncbi:MAG: ribonuclease P protein component [Angustibacter sp.]
MLPPLNRLRRRADFDHVVRCGVRLTSPLIVAHYCASVLGSEDNDGRFSGPRIGLIVSRHVGTAVTRNLVKRRLRAKAASRLAEFSVPSFVVLRVLPKAGNSDARVLNQSADRVFDAAVSEAASSGTRESTF